MGGKSIKNNGNTGVLRGVKPENDPGPMYSHLKKLFTSGKRKWILEKNFFAVRDDPSLEVFKV